MAKRETLPFQRLLTLYKQEGLLHRIVSTEYAHTIVLKGGLLFYQLHGIVSRPTKDIDLLGLGEGDSPEALQAVLVAAARIALEDGLEFDADSTVVEPIRGQAEHTGVRGFITSYLGQARTRLQIDMGFGDVIDGGAVERPYRTLLGNRDFSMSTYSEEAAAGEKLEAVVSLGTINSRYKDLYDLYDLLILSNVDESKIANAAAKTFMNRRTTVPITPRSLTDERWTSDEMNDDWDRFLKRINEGSPSFVTLRDELLPRLRRVYAAARERVQDRDSV